MSLPNDNIFFSIVMPAHNEEGCIEATCRAITEKFQSQGIEDYEILVVNDNSRDATESIVNRLAAENPRVWHVNNPPPHGYGFAVRQGLAHYRGECACIVMADLSDSPDDIVAYYNLMKAGHECVFGSRFIRGAKVIDYPWLKYVINRLANHFIKILFRIDHNDLTNAFKCFRRHVIDGLQPLISNHFNLTVELSLKSIVRGYKHATIPISWTNRKAGESKLKIKEMGSRYLFIVLYAWIEKRFSKGDYHRSSARAAAEPPVTAEMNAAHSNNPEPGKSATARP